jgi:hypothetical protein
MSVYEHNDGQFPDETTVWTPYPLADDGNNRELWPWLQGTVLGQCGPDEWHIVIDAPELIEHGDGYDWSPACFRDSSELRAVMGAD